MSVLTANRSNAILAWVSRQRSKGREPTSDEIWERIRYLANS